MQKYVYKINNSNRKLNMVNFKSNKLIHLCVFTIVEKSRRNPYQFFLYLLNKDFKNKYIIFSSFSY